MSGEKEIGAIYWKESLSGLHTVCYVAKLNIEILQCALPCHKEKWPIVSYRMVGVFGRSRGWLERSRVWEGPLGAPTGFPPCVNNAHNQRAWQLKATWRLFQIIQLKGKKTKPRQRKWLVCLSAWTSEWVHVHTWLYRDPAQSSWPLLPPSRAWESGGH